jgi:hypothetical protein
MKPPGHGAWDLKVHLFVFGASKGPYPQMPSHEPLRESLLLLLALHVGDQLADETPNGIVLSTQLARW